MSAKNKRSAKDLNNSVTSTPVKPSKKLVTVDDEMESDLKKLFELVAQMNSKLDKLDNIERHLARVDQDIRDLKRVLLTCEPASHASHSASHASHASVAKN